MNESAKDFFDQESNRYDAFVKGRDFVPVLKEKVNPVLRGRVLDVGSGCINDFKEGSFDSYIAMDLSFGMVSGIEQGGRVRAVCGDATALPFQDNTFDIILYRAVLHHLNPEGNKPRRMEEILKNVLAEARRLLAKDGRILVIEPCLPRLLEGFERVFSSAIRCVMRVFGLPYVFLFSRRGLERLLRTGEWSTLEVDLVQGTGKKWGWIAPILGLPFIKIPRWASPSRIYLFQGRR
jgi:SAM-dependent methyltransferase